MIPAVCLTELMLAATVYRPLLPLPVLAALGLVAACVVGWRAWAERGQAGAATQVLQVLARLSVVGCLLWMLAGPSRVERSPSGLAKPALDVLVDRSGSMAQQDETIDGQPATRLEAVAHHWLSGPALRTLGEVADVRLHEFDAASRPLGFSQIDRLVADGEHTHLIEAVRARHRGRRGGAASPGGALLVLSDGHDTRRPLDEATLALLRESGRAVFAVPVGQQRVAQDVSVQLWAEADRLTDGQRTTLHAVVAQRGLPGRGATLRIEADGQTIHEQRIELGRERIDQAIRVQPRVAPGRDVSLAVYEAVVTLDEAGPPETFTDNNRRTTYVQVTREPLRVLLLEGRPYWDTRFLASAWATDPQIAFTAAWRLNADRVTTTSDEESADTPLTLPITEDALAGFDVVVLGKGVEGFFAERDVSPLARYVRQRGGSLVLARGRPFDALPDAAAREIEPLMPVRWGERAVTDLRLRLTPEGRSSPLLASDAAGADAVYTELPGMVAATRVVGERAASIVLLRGESDAGLGPDGGGAYSQVGIATMRVGRGGVLAVLGDGLWRWAMARQRSGEASPVYDRFWARALHWLASGGEFLPGQRVSLSLSRSMAEPGEPVTAQVVTRYVEADTFQPRLRVTGPDGAAREVVLERDSPRSNRYVATVARELPGTYRLVLVDEGTGGILDPAAPIESRLVVARRGAEWLDPSPRPGVLRAMADATGGRCLALDEQEPLVAHLRALREASLRPPEVTYDALRWPVLAWIGVALFVEWLIRRRAGLP